MRFKRIRDLREDKDLYQKDIALILGISQQYYSEYENGNYTIPVEHLIKLARFYNTSVDYILGLTDNKDPYKKKRKWLLFYSSINLLIDTITPSPPYSTDSFTIPLLEFAACIICPSPAYIATCPL